MSMKRAMRYLGAAAITSAIAAAGAPSGAAIGVPSGGAAPAVAGDSVPVAETAAETESGFQWDDAAVGAAVAAAFGGLTAALGGARRSRSSRAQHVLS
jgi:hypothetical protein